MPDSSELQPIDPSSIQSSENETEARWIVRKLVGSMTGRIIMSSYESFRAAGSSVVCLSPWGDSSPLILPCIRFRDLAMHMVIAATGGTAAIAAPVMAPVGDAIVSTLGDTIIVELGIHAGFDVGVKVANDLLIEHPLKQLIPSNDRRLSTTAIKSLTITLKYKHTMTDAALGFYRSSFHADPSLFSSVKDYLAVEKGWFSPYLFASGRRPIIPRTMTPDVVFCHGPFLAGDYKIGQTLLNESATIIALCKPPPPLSPAEESKSDSHPVSQSRLHVPSSISNMVHSTAGIFSRSRPSSPTPIPSRPPSPPQTGEPTEKTLDPALPVTVLPPRRMVLVVLGIKPHRVLWTTSARPDESIIEYILLNGCPAIVVPVKPGSPLIAWDTLTLEELHKFNKQPGGVESEKAKGAINTINEYLGLCVDWERVITGSEEEKKKDIAGTSAEDKQKAEESLLVEKQASVKEAVRLLVIGAINSAESKEVKKKIDLDRAGIAMFRIP